MNIPYKFSTPLENYSFDSEIWEQSKGYNNISYMKDVDECFTFAGYPDYSDSYKFTNYWSINPNTSIFGIHIGDSLEYTENIMKNYEYWKENDSIDDIKYTKGRVSIWVEFNSIISSTDTDTRTISTVERFHIIIKSTDWFHKGYYK